MSKKDGQTIPTTNPQAIAYNAQVTALGIEAPLPTLTARYGPELEQRLEVYAPASGVERRPILLFFHGGAWISGSPAWLRFMAAPVLAQGAIFIAGTYRLAPGTRWPGQYEDVRDALDFVARESPAWGGDAGRIVISGHSAGGHLAALATLKQEAAPPIACLPISSSFDLRYGDVSLESDAGRVYRYLLADRSQDGDASPICFTDGNRVPFHIVWGERDFDRVIASSEGMVESLARSPAPVSHAVVARASHFDTHLALADPASPWYEALRRAFGRQRELKGDLP